MGCKLSAALAQGVSNAAAKHARLPASRRLLPGLRCPMGPPVWGSIIDDLWVLHEENSQPGDDTEWAPKMVDAWDAAGVSSHPSKAVDYAKDIEVQGAVVSHVNPSMRLSALKESLLFRGTLRAAACYRPARRCIERLLGKHGHAHCFRPPLRSLGGHVHRWVHDARVRDDTRLFNNHDCLLELVMHALFLPHAVMSFRAPWCPRAEASDASPGGHGRAYTTLPVDEVRTWATVAAHRGDYTNLLMDPGLCAPSLTASKIQRAVLPIREHYWHEIPREGFYRHIALEEYACCFQLVQRESCHAGG